MDALPWPLAGAAALRERLLEAYVAPGRGYHDRRHLTEVLANVDRLVEAGEPADRTAVLLAAWFHDAVYDGTADDEERSAALAETELPAAGLDPAAVAEVARLVRVTAGHAPRDGDHNGAVLCDADLAILAAGPERYRDYVAGVRKEYAHVPDPQFAAGRAAVLEGLLAGPTLFHTPAGRRWWEPAARRNAEQELAALRAG